MTRKRLVNYKSFIIRCLSGIQGQLFRAGFGQHISSFVGNGSNPHCPSATVSLVAKLGDTKGDRFIDSADTAQTKSKLGMHSDSGFSRRCQCRRWHRRRAGKKQGPERRRRNEDQQDRYLRFRRLSWPAASREESEIDLAQIFQPGADSAADRNLSRPFGITRFAQMAARKLMTCFSLL
jgi:hypothetical protein